MDTQRFTILPQFKASKSIAVSTIAIAVSMLALASQPLNALPLFGIERTEESEKCEWLGVCDSPEARQESDRCVWLGICD
ncbi:MAG: hypothetical protein ACFB9N_07245 [Geitlerinemataceae cyanobacterium]